MPFNDLTLADRRDLPRILKQDLEEPYENAGPPCHSLNLPLANELGGFEDIFPRSVGY